MVLSPLALAWLATDSRFTAVPSRRALAGMLSQRLTRNGHFRSMWQLDGNIACWNCELVSAAFDLLAPADGIRIRKVQRHAVDAVHILQVHFPGPISAGSIDAYVRTGDLIVRYPECPQSGFGLQLRWSLIPDPSVTAVELLVSVHTSRLSLTTSLDIGNRFDPTVREGYSAQGEPVRTPPTGSRSAEDRPQVRCGLVLCRPLDVTWSYAEMTNAHAPTIRDEWSQPPHPSGGFRLFDGVLEKGVIRRARMRGIFFPRVRDLAVACQHFQAFLEAPTQLDT